MYTIPFVEIVVCNFNNFAKCYFHKRDHSIQYSDNRHHFGDVIGRVYDRGREFIRDKRWTLKCFGAQLTA